MKKLALRLMHASGMFAMARSMSAGMARILMYHNFCRPGETGVDPVDSKALRDQFEYLRRHFHVVPLGQTLERLAMGKRPHSRAVSLTIDDGRRNCYEILFPILKELGLPATFFVVSSFIRGEDWIWTDKVHWLSEQRARPEELDPANLDGFFHTLNQMRPEVRDRRIESIAAAMKISIPKCPPPNYSPCSWSELREMADSGLVEIGSHTVTHPILASVTDEESWFELTTSRADIEEGMGRKVSAFCFPNGKPGDYRPSQLRQVCDAGYAGAVVTRFSLAGPGTDPYQLPRMGISGRSDPLTFAKYVDGAEYYQAQLERSIGLRPVET